MRLFETSPAVGMELALAIFGRYRFFRFLAIGAVNTAFGYAIFFIALMLTGDAIRSALVSTIAGVIFNFRSIGAVVFQSNDHSLFARFICVYVIVFLVNAGALTVSSRLDVAPALAQAALLPALAILSYVLNREFVFRPFAGGVK